MRHHSPSRAREQAGVIIALRYSPLAEKGVGGDFSIPADEAGFIGLLQALSNSRGNLKALTHPPEESMIKIDFEMVCSGY